MRKICTTILFSLTICMAQGQVVFNKIIEDTIAHITSSVIALDTGYVFLSGTGNEYNVRSFALTYLNENGNKQWKHIYGDAQNEVWEGWFGNYKKLNSLSYLSGSYVNPSEGKKGIHISVFDSLFNLESQNIIFYDTIDKRAFYTLRTSNDYYYIIGQICDYEDDETYKLLLLKADNSGEYLWHKYYNINLSEFGSRIIETSDKHLVIGGRTEVTSIENTRWYLLKTDTAGNVIWEQAYGRNNYNNGKVNGLIETQDSNYLACGAYPVARYGGGGGEYLWDGCLRKIDTAGELLWEKHYRDYYLSHTGDIYLHNSISDLVKLDDSYYILGSNYDCISWKNRAYLAKLNKHGAIEWKRDYYAIDTNSFSQWLVSFKHTNDNGFILAGYGNEYDMFGYNPPQQAWLVKTDSLGIDGLCYTAPPELNIDIVLPATLNCSDTITVYAYIAGKSAPYTIETSIGQVIDSIYYPPTFVPIEIGLTHVNLEWDNSTYFEQTITEATLSNHEWGQCIAKPIEFYTPHTSGLQQITITVTDAYGESMTITKEVFVNDNCGSGIAGESVNSVNVYPNPAKDKIYVDIPNEFTPNNAEIFNSSGQLVKVVKAHNGLNVVDVSDLAVGSYIIKLDGKSTDFTVVR